MALIQIARESTPAVVRGPSSSQAELPGMVAGSLGLEVCYGKIVKLARAMVVEDWNQADFVSDTGATYRGKGKVMENDK